MLFDRAMNLFLTEFSWTYAVFLKSCTHFCSFQRRSPKRGLRSYKSGSGLLGRAFLEICQPKHTDVSQMGEFGNEDLRGICQRASVSDL